jgi:flavin-dependent dehydrogenase
VADRERFKASGLSPEEFLQRSIESAPYVAARMEEATRTDIVRARKDFSYRMSRLTGKNFVLVGDAAGFIDPIFSTGVFMAMRSAEIAADAASRFVRKGTFSDLRRYEKRFGSAYAKYLKFVSNFYTREFLEVFLSPSDRWGLFRVVIDVLAGSVFESKGDRFKLWLFFMVVSAQRRLGVIAPRIPWDRLAETAQS